MYLVPARAGVRSKSLLHTVEADPALQAEAENCEMLQAWLLPNKAAETKWRKRGTSPVLRGKTFIVLFSTISSNHQGHEFEAESARHGCSLSEIASISCNLG